jgi:hypothetical protein
MAEPVFAIGWQRHEGSFMAIRSNPPTASRGTLAGDALWLAVIAFVFSIIMGLVG